MSNLDSIKKYLSQIRYLDKLIERDKKEIQRLSVISTTIPSIEIQDKVQTSPKGEARYESLVAIKIDRINLLKSRIEEREKIIAEIDLLINRLSNNEGIEILSAYYIDRKSLRSIASENYLSKSKVYEIYKKSLEELQSML